MITLGLDPSLKGFGWVVHNPLVTGEARVIAKGVLSTSSKDTFVRRYVQLREALCYILDTYKEIEVVGAESPPYGEQYSEGLYALFVYVNEAVYLSRRNVVYFDPSTLKMLARMDPSVRRGKMDKGDMIDAAKSETGVKRWNHNEADAYIVARSAARFWQFEAGLLLEEDLTPSEKRSFHRVHTYIKGAKAGQVTRGGLIFREDDRFFKFSNVPPDPEEEEFLQWLILRGSKRVALPPRQLKL